MLCFLITLITFLNSEANNLKYSDLNPNKQIDQPLMEEHNAVALSDGVLNPHIKGNSSFISVQLGIWHT